jgi:hypothetical protein
LFPPDEEIAMSDTHFGTVYFRPAHGTISTQAEQNALEAGLAQPVPRTGTDAGVAASEPPLYYALESIPYRLAGGTVLDRLALMRLFSACLGGLTALFAFLFIQEALPDTPWAWSVGGLSVALAPLLAMMSGAVNPDALCFAVSAALFCGLARAFRSGLTPKLAATIGATIAVGYLTKLEFLGLLPGALLGLVVLSLRTARTSIASACRALALATLFAATPILIYVIGLHSGSLQTAALTGSAANIGQHSSMLDEIEYIWQFYLPRLPGMTAYFHGVLTTRVLWFNGLVGLYGWLDTTFPNWVYNAALVPAGVIAALIANALFKDRAALRARLAESAVYFMMSLGILTIIGASDYTSQTPGEFREPRYLLPMLALWGLALALAARGLGRRWGPLAGTLIVLLFLAHDIFSQLLVISRFYG